MLKFKNREKRTGKEYLYKISMSSVQGGIDVEVDEVQVELGTMKVLQTRTLLLTPMDAAAFAHQTRVTNGYSCRPVGHGVGVDASGTTLSARKISRLGSCPMEFVGGVAEVLLSIGGVTMSVPTFVIDAMRLAIERMFESLMFPSTGDMEEEFG